MLAVKSLLKAIMAFVLVKFYTATLLFVFSISMTEFGGVILSEASTLIKSTTGSTFSQTGIVNISQIENPTDLPPSKDRKLIPEGDIFLDQSEDDFDPNTNKSKRSKATLAMVKSAVGLGDDSTGTSALQGTENAESSVVATILDPLGLKRTLLSTAYGAGRAVKDFGSNIFGQGKPTESETPMSDSDSPQRDVEQDFDNEISSAHKTMSFLGFSVLVTFTSLINLL